MADQEHLAKILEGPTVWNAWRNTNPDVWPDLRDAELSRSDLGEADLSDGDLSGVDLSLANLCGADFSRVDLRWAILIEADLSRALLRGANLSGTHLYRAKLGKAKYLAEAKNITEADLSEADLSEVNLREANLRGAKLSKVNMCGATLTGVDLSWADLTDANLRGADLSEANLNDTDFSNADLEGANLSYVQLIGSHLVNANLCNANLFRANLSGAKLIRADLRGAIFEKAVLIEIKDLCEATNLSQADFSNANLEGAELSSMQLIGAKLTGANLRSTNLHGADLNVADLRNVELESANLVEVNLSKADLSGAKCRRANFIKANLSDANCTGADLSGTKLGKAKLRKTNLRNTDLHDADMLNTTDFSGEQLGGANVSGTELPEAVKDFKGLENVEKACVNSRRLFFIVLLGCLYSLVTIATTNDARLLTNTISSPLPIMGVAVPIVSFYLVAALLLFGLYIYFHIYLQRLWENLGVLPAIFPDGKPLDKKAYPWFLNGLINAYFQTLSDNRPPLIWLQVVLSVILAWGAVPATLLLFWIRYLRRHEWFITYAHILLLSVSILAGVTFFLLASKTLQGEVKGVKQFRWKETLRDRRARWFGVFLICTIMVFFLFSYGTINGVKTDRNHIGHIKINDVCKWVPIAFGILNYDVFLDLTGAEISSKPPNWRGLKDQAKADFSLIKGANLGYKNLRYASASGAYLVKANLSRSDLEGIDLQGADLAEADLHGASLVGANLSGANLLRVNLKDADLRHANLNRARNLKIEQLSEAKTLYGITLDEEHMKVMEGKYHHLLSEY